ncbi:MAG: protoporphyrinogen oxidase [Bryobacteraceae bacterium]|nr:protoporphyrinogen oxidase [Bryobacteraceae bacterium]
MRDVIIIGGGISGLTAAYTLAKAGRSVTLIEREASLGGLLQTRQLGGCVIEAGPDSFLAAKPAATDLIREVGLADDLIGSNDHQRVTYIQRHGRLVPMPDGLMMMVPTKIWPMVTTPLLSWPTKIRMGLEYFRRPPVDELPERSVADFVRNHYGQEAVDYLAEPLLSGVYGGDPADLSINSTLTRFVDLEKQYGSLTRGTLASRQKAPPGSASLFRTLKGGLHDLVKALTARLPGVEHLRGEASAIRYLADGYEVALGGEWLAARHLIIATPAWAASRLLADLDPQLHNLLRQVDYSSSMTVALGYRDQDLAKPLTGFGFLVPAKERQTLVACTFVGRKFAHRTPEGVSLLRCFLGGAGRAAVLEQSDEEILAATRADLQRLLGLTATPVFHSISRWPRSMAQYTVGHARRMAEVDERTRRHPGLHLIGNAYRGIGIPDCIQLARETAGRILA